MAAQSSDVCGGYSPAQDHVGPVLTSVRERHDTTTRPAQTHPLGAATRSAWAHGRTRHNTARQPADHPCTTQQSMQSSAKGQPDRRTHAPHSWFRGVPQRTPRESRDPSTTTCRRAVVAPWMTTWSMSSQAAAMLVRLAGRRHGYELILMVMLPRLGYAMADLRTRAGSRSARQ